MINLRQVRIQRFLLVPWYPCADTMLCVLWLQRLQLLKAKGCIAIEPGRGLAGVPAWLHVLYE
jgi:hypothetical protein